jgi:hypothetical protein
MLVKRSWVAVALGALGTVALGFGVAAAGSHHDPDTSFTVRVETDMATYERTETVRIMTTVCSQSWWWRTTSEGPTNWEVMDGVGNVVADTSHRIYALDLRRQIWAPRQCRTIEDTWDQHYWNRPGDARQEPDGVVGTAVRGDTVPPGSYHVESRWSSAAWDKPPRALAPVSSEAFTLRG